MKNLIFLLPLPLFSFTPLSYRDPLIGLIIFFSIIFIISLSSYWFGIFKKKEEEKDIGDFIKKFELSNCKDLNYKKIFENTNLTSDEIILIATSYEKIGDYEKAINLLLLTLQKDNDKTTKQNILYSLGKLYFKAGFLQKAQDAFIKSLKLSPRDKNSLKYLLVIYEKQFDFKNAKDVLNALEEMDEEVQDEIDYINTLEIIHSNLSLDEKINKISLYVRNGITIQRIFFEYLVKNNFLNISFENFDFKNMIDLIYNVESKKFFLKNEKDPFVRAVGNIKGFIDKDINENINFELKVLIHLKKTNFNEASLNFEYMCNECKNIFPIPFNRCPKCQTINSLVVETILTKAY